MQSQTRSCIQKRSLYRVWPNTAKNASKSEVVTAPSLFKSPGSAQDSTSHDPSSKEAKGL